MPSAPPTRPSCSWPTSSASSKSWRGISKDLQRPDEAQEDYRQIARAVEQLQRRYAGPLRIEQLAQSAGVSVDRFERLVRRIFQATRAPSPANSKRPWV